MKKGFSFVSLLVIASLLVSGLSMAIPSNAMALKSADPVEEALTRAYQAEQQWLNNQQQAINKADQAAVEVQQVIDKAIEAGLDVTMLQNALAAFNSSMAVVKSEHQTAANILAAHNGFDIDGNVTDRQAARITVLDTKQALWRAHVTMTQAVSDLYRAVKEWRVVTLP